MQLLKLQQKFYIIGSMNEYGQKLNGANMNELKKIYFRVKSQSGDFKNTLELSFTGDELFHLIIQIQQVYNAELVTPEDIKWVNKLLYYIQPFPAGAA